jgi:hypothetical protein
MSKLLPLEQATGPARTDTYACPSCGAALRPVRAGRVIPLWRCQGESCGQGFPRVHKTEKELGWGSPTPAPARKPVPIPTRGCGLSRLRDGKETY